MVCVCVCVYAFRPLPSSDVNVKGQNGPGGIHLLKAQTLLQSFDIFVYFAGCYLKIRARRETLIPGHIKPQS
jgi:hypothetical protein